MLRFHACLACLTIVVIAGCESAPGPVATRAPEVTSSTSPASAPAVEYEFAELDVPAELGAFTSAFGINNAGVITGNYGNVDGTVHGFLYRRGNFTDFVVPGAGGFISGTLGHTNNRGTSSGYYSDSSDIGHAVLRAFDGTLTYLPDPLPGAIDTDPSGLNDHGVLVGVCRDAAGKAHGFVYRDGSYELYDHPGATSTRINGINNQDVMVGQWSAAGIVHGFILENGQTTALEFPGARSTRAAAINNHGAIVGFYNNNDGVFHGFLYDNGNFTTVDFPGSSDSAALDINDTGIIVGTYNDFSFGFVAFPGHGPSPAEELLTRD